MICAERSCAEKRHSRILSKVFFFKAVLLAFNQTGRDIPCDETPVFVEVVKTA